MKRTAVGFKNSAAKCLVFHWLARREPNRFLNVLLRRLSFNRCSRHGFKGSSCFQDADLRVWKTSFLGHESSFSFICGGGSWFIGQPIFDYIPSSKDRVWQCLRPGLQTA